MNTFSQVWVFSDTPSRLPELKDIQKVSRAIAFAVGKMAQQQGVAVKTSAEALQQASRSHFYWPVGQAVKTPPFHGGIPGSIPGRVTT